MDDFYTGPFAAVYDRFFTPDLDGIAGAIRRYAEETLARPEKTMVDLCCGTGRLLTHFAAHGYDAVGVDISDGMLALAAQRNEEPISRGMVRLVEADARTFEVHGQVALVTCTSNSLSNLEDLTALADCFQRVREVVRDGGLFIFDIHSTTGLRMQNYSLTRDLPDLLLSTKITYDPFSDRAVARITGFSRFDGAPDWRRFDQSASITAWPAADVCKALASAGFVRSWPCRLDDLAVPVAQPDSVPHLYFVAQG
jgi:SAM-dependent methyltransferase